MTRAGKEVTEGEVTAPKTQVGADGLRGGGHQSEGGLEAQGRGSHFLLKSSWSQEARAELSGLVCATTACEPPRRRVSAWRPAPVRGQ